MIDSCIPEKKRIFKDWDGGERLEGLKVVGLFVHPIIFFIYFFNFIDLKSIHDIGIDFSVS